MASVIHSLDCAQLSVKRQHNFTISHFIVYSQVITMNIITTWRD